jgi:hypothetical protein
MPETRGRAAGRWRCPRPCGGGREPRGDQRSRQTTLQVWRAVCAETCKHGFGGGRRVNVPQGNALAVYPTHQSQSN